MMIKKRFLVEIEIPENTGDLCWDEDETGLQAFHDCIVSALPEINLRNIVNAQNKCIEYQDFIERQNKVRESFKIIKEDDDND